MQTPAELLMLSVPCSSSLRPVKDDREGPMVEGIPAKEEERRPQGHQHSPQLRPGLWPFCTPSREASSLQAQRGPASTGVQQGLQPPQRRHLRRLPPGVGVQRADVSQEHERVTLGSVQGEEEAAQEPSYNGAKRDRERGVGGERGRAVTVRRKGIKDCFLKRCLKKKEDASLCWGKPICLLCVLLWWWWWRWQGAFNF